MMSRAAIRTGVLCLALGLSVPGGRAAEPLLDAFAARPLGPANMGGRITDLAVVENRPATMYVATASGGLWKTVNNGTTWEPVFDHQATAAVGAVTVAPSHPDVVWVGTGEANPRNSVAWGDGVYKSGDGGRTWTNTGLRDSAHVGRIVVHPKNPDVVYVAALGHVWGPNKERGLFKTADGGKSWRPALFLNDDTGCIDVVMDPGDPETLYAAFYQCRRDAFAGGNPAVQCGPGGGLFKTTDGGKTWTRLTQGLPERPLGRCGLAVYPRDPRVVYAVVQTDQTATAPGQPSRTSDYADNGGVFRSDDKGATWAKLNDLCPRPFYYGQIRVDPNDDRRVYVLGPALYASRDGGRAFRGNVAAGVHPDHHALWIDPRDADHLVLGGDGGLSFSYDGGATWEHVNNLPLAQFYAVAVDMRKPYRVYGGLQDNGTWTGPSATPSARGITNADWHRLLGADGFYCQSDPTDPDTLYAEGQYGRLHRVNVRTGEAVRIRPAAAHGRPAYRFNWCAPILLSPHDPRTVYYGGNHLFRSADRGEHWQVISPDLTRGAPGPSADAGHTITTVAESPRAPGVLYVGTDDGRVHVSRDGGATWTDRSDKIPDVSADRWVSRVECSRFADGTAYLALDRHRRDDRRPYLFKTTDYGATWRPLANDLPREGPVYVIREDLKNPDLLFAGTEAGLFVSTNGGVNWHRLHNGLPTVAVHDLVIHPRDRELVIGTHGRGIYVMDVAPLEDLTPPVRASSAHLFDVKPAVRFAPRHADGWTGAKAFVAPNPPYGATITYYLKDAPPAPVRLAILDAAGRTLALLPAAGEAGLHHVTWNLRAETSPGSCRFGPRVPAGEYVARLEVGGTVLMKKIRVVDE